MGGKLGLCGGLVGINWGCVMASRGLMGAVGGLVAVNWGYVMVRGAE